GPEGKGMVAAWMAQDGLHSLDGNPQPRQVSVAKFSLAQSGAILTTDEEDFVRALYGVQTILVPEHLGGVLNDDGTKVAFADSGVWETDLDPLSMSFGAPRLLWPGNDTLEVQWSGADVLWVDEVETKCTVYYNSIPVSTTTGCASGVSGSSTELVWTEDR